MPETMLDVPKMRFSATIETLKSSMSEINFSYREKFAKINAKLVSLNPMAVLSRGYSAVFNENGAIIKSSKSVSVGDKIKIKLNDGEFKATVTEDNINA